MLAPVVQRADNFTQQISHYPREQFYFNLYIWPDFFKATHLIIDTLFAVFTNHRPMKRFFYVFYLWITAYPVD